MIKGDYLCFGAVLDLHNTLLPLSYCRAKSGIDMAQLMISSCTDFGHLIVTYPAVCTSQW